MARVIPAVDLSPLPLNFCLFVLCATLGAQTSQPHIPEEPANIEGIVQSDATGQPLQRAQAALQPVEGGQGGLVQTTNETGAFSFLKVAAADAVAVGLGPGQEVAGIDIFLTRVHTLRIHGRVTSALSGSVIRGPSITLRWNDPDNTGSVSAPVNVSFDKDQNFEIRGVTTGPYLVITTGVDDGQTLSARTPISVGDADVANLDIVIGPEQGWKGRLRIEGDDSTALSGLQVSLEPRRATASATRATVEKNGDFSLPFVPQETYDLLVSNAPADAYLKAVRVGNADRLATGLEAEPGGAPAALEVVLSLHGGGVAGKALTPDPAVVATCATVMLVPDPPVGRVQAYKTTFADEYGNFLARGLAPGNYVLLA